ncbi:MAG: SpoIID/LytB domain-containing protein, partial [Actinomycetota bacterium]|nr:SpoIID/LytB domain-containing protein [Actinomycetota bacterium]
MPDRLRLQVARTRPPGTLLALLLIIVALLLISLPTQRANAADGDWVIEGGGWGHGIGLSQYGAYGMGLDGWTAKEILAHYYSGAFPVPASASLGTDHWIFDAEALWIGLDQDADSVDLEAVNGQLSVCQPGHGTDDCVTPDLVIVPGATWRLETVLGSDPVQCRFVDPSTETQLPAGDCSADVMWVDNASLADPSAATLVRINGDEEYAHGSVRIRPNDPDPAVANGFHVALSVGLEDYIYGIGEVPSSWPPATLEAQAMIARSFGVAAATMRAPSGTLPTYRQRQCWCHLDATSIDQNYAGWSKESEGRDAEWGKRWVAAVDATSGSVLNHASTGSTIISTYYSSSTGGATENNEDVWSGTPRAYLRSVDDHWATEPQVNNRYATWAVDVSPSSMLSALDEGWDAVVSARMLEGPPGTIVEFTGTLAGATVKTTRTGNWFRVKFDVRSPYVSGVIAPATDSPDPEPPNPEPEPDPPFVDIDGSIHYDSIAYIWREGITKGCNPPTNDRFCPTDSVTRGQMAAFLTRALNLPSTPENFFVDDGDSIFEGDINRLAAAGITKGCNPPSNDRFCVEGKVTRGEMAAFLVRAFAYSDNGGGDLFTDDDTSIFEGDIDRLATAGVTKGCNPPSNTRFCPDRTLSREEMATFLYR